jgi:ADP-ribosyl-[dinitrogen reductase] hydrolase
MSPHTAAALHRFQQTGTFYGDPAQDTDRGSDGLVRLAPVVLAYGGARESAIAVAQLQSRLTHASPVCQRAAANLAQVMVTGDAALCPRPDAPPEPVTDTVVDVLHAAFWALTQGQSFGDVLQAGVQLGGAACAVGSVTGQLAGRIYGYDAIPQNWRRALLEHDKILTAAQDLYVLRPIDQ